MIKKKIVIFVLIIIGLLLILFVLFNADIISDDILIEHIEEKPEIENIQATKWDYHTRTYDLGGGQYLAEIGGAAVNFYDGYQFVELENAIDPQLEKKYIWLNEKQPSNLVEYGTYTLHRGLTVDIENHELIVKDANNLALAYLSRPWAEDNTGERVDADYIIDQVDDKLDVYVEIDENWLASAEYPVLVDPTPTLDNSTGMYDGTIEKIVGVYLRGVQGTLLYLGDITGTDYRSFIEFNTTSIPDTAQISKVNLSLTVAIAYGAGDDVNITRFNNTQISDNSTFPNNNSGNINLYENISQGAYNAGAYLTGLSNFQSTGIKTFNLTDGGVNATGDLQDQLDDDYFAIGLVGDDEGVGASHCQLGGSNSNSTNSPKLYVTYVAVSTCTPPAAGDWECNTTCSMDGLNYTIDGNLFVYDNCFLNLTGTTNLSFIGNNRIIYIYPGGGINLSDTAGINKE